MIACHRQRRKQIIIAGDPQRAPSSPLIAAGPHIPPWTPRPSNSPAGLKFRLRRCPRGSFHGFQFTSSAPAVERCSGKGPTLTECCRSSKRSCILKTGPQMYEIDRGKSQVCNALNVEVQFSQRRTSDLGCFYAFYKVIFLFIYNS